MDDVQFFDRAGPFSLGELAGWTGATIARGNPGDLVTDLAPLDTAGAGDLAFFDNPKYAADLAASAAGAVLMPEKATQSAPDRAAVLVVRRPGDAFSDLMLRFYPDALRPMPIWEGEPAASGVHPEARLEEGVVVEPGAIVGPQAEIGRGTRIMAGSIVGRRVRIGRDCSIGPGATVVHAILGDRVVVHAGVRIGQDGFGYVMGASGHRKVPQVGRAVIQDDVEIGANTTVDRGALRDTVIGEGTKIDNQVQIGHNVVIGRHCVIVSQVGIAGSARIGDFVAIGGQAGVMPHVTVADGAQVATLSAVRDDLAAGGRYGGVPARPARDWLRETAALQKLAQEFLARRGRKETKGEGGRERDDD